MKFETAPIQNQIQCRSYDEAKMYLMFLEIDGKRGWRMPTRYERTKYFRVGQHVNEPVWDLLDEDTVLLNNKTRRLIPVRDRNDDN
jgi:hypothetical protein